VSVPEDQYGKPCECPQCKALLLIPRKKGKGGEAAAVEAEAKSFDDFKQEILDAIRPDMKRAEGGPDVDALARRVSDMLKPELGKWAAAQATAATAGIDADALKAQLQADILKEVKGEIAAIHSAPAVDAASTAAFAKAIEALGEKLAAGAGEAAQSKAVEEKPKTRKPPRRPFAPRHREEVEIPESLPEAYPPVGIQEPDVARVIELNAGDDENLRAFLNEIASLKGRLVMFEPSQSAIDVGNWRKRKVWLAVTDERIVLASYGRKTFRQEIGLQDVKESFWNEFTSEVVFVPYPSQEGGLRSVKLTEDRGRYLLGLIHHGVPAQPAVNPGPQ
jgi:hypothetical protein